MLLLITLLGPIRFLGGTADALKWGCCCRLLHFGPLYLWKALPIHSDGPIASVDAAADCFDSAYYFLGGTANALRWAHCIGDAATNYFAWAHKISVRHCRCIWMGPLHWQMLLPITLLWPIIFLGGTADALRWAYCIGGCCCQLLCFGPIYFWEALLMHSDGPIALADAAVDCFSLAHWVSGRHCQCTQMGPLYWWMLLPMASFWLIIFLGGTTNALRWAHCISRCCCRWLHFGPLSFCEALSMHSHGPIALVNAAANGFTLIPNTGHKYALDTAGFLSNKMFPWTCHFL